MNIFVDNIKELLKKSEYFNTIPDIDNFADKLWNTYHKDLVSDISKMEIWLDANPRKRKKNYARFIVNWMNRSNNYGQKTQFSKQVF